MAELWVMPAISQSVFVPVRGETTESKDGDITITFTPATRTNAYEPVTAVFRWVECDKQWVNIQQKSNYFFARMLDGEGVARMHRAYDSRFMVLDILRGLGSILYQIQWNDVHEGGVEEAARAVVVALNAIAPHLNDEARSRVMKHVEYLSK